MNTSQEKRHLDEIRLLREENCRLKSLLDEHGIAWRETENTPPAVDCTSITSTSKSSQLSLAEKVALFRRLFRGRTDVFPLRWESAKGKSGYSPACANEWKRGLCIKPKGKCADCGHRQLLPVTNQVIYDHLSGKHTIGVYPLLNNDTCCFLAIDFDDEDWRADVDAVIKSCRDFSLPAAVEISRSGNGAHLWLFFLEQIPVCEARKLGSALISHACNYTRQLSLTSYDRFFPNQNTLPKGGFGNLIALPLQKLQREHGRSVFVDENFTPYPDQWAFLNSIRPLSAKELEGAILQTCGGRNPLDVAFAADENGDDNGKPWQRAHGPASKISVPLPKSLDLVLANQIFVAKADLPQPLLNRIIRLAAFQNPEFYKSQAMRLPVWNKPRIICCAENFSQYIGLPRGCLDTLIFLLRKNGIKLNLQDERVSGGKIAVKFNGTLRKDQKNALKAMLKTEIGVLHAPTAFGKTVTAAALIAKRNVSTLVLVHRAELMRQWQERLTEFLAISNGSPGIIGGGKNRSGGQIDIALLQSLSRMAQEKLAELLDKYGQIIVDECHHLSAFSFEAILKQAKAKYVLGLTATPIRRDGHHPIIFMQCGEIRHSAPSPQNAPSHMEVWPRLLPVPDIPSDSTIQNIFRSLANNTTRNMQIARDVKDAYLEGRKILVLTERTDHLEILRSELEAGNEHCYMLHGKLPKKQRTETLNALAAMHGRAPRILLATGRLVGEGFDHSPLDTLVLAMPISWKGTLQQYAGRLHRQHADKRDVRIYDYVEAEHATLGRMWEKRRRGYTDMGYEIIGSDYGEGASNLNKA